MISQSRLLPVGPKTRLLRVPVKWLWQEAEAGRVPCLKADMALLFDHDTVERVLLDRARGTEQQGAES